MKQEQYKKYFELLNEIKDVKRFLEGGCGYNHNKFFGKYQFGFILRYRIDKRIFFLRKWGNISIEENTFEIPNELQERIIKTTEEWLKEKEQELESI